MHCKITQTKLGFSEIIENLTSVQSKRLLEEHLQNPSFDAAWDIFMVLRQLSFSGFYDVVTEIQPVFELITESRLMYRVLFKLCSIRGPATRTTPLLRSPFKG